MEGIVQNWTGVYGHATINEPLQRNIFLHRKNVSGGVDPKSLKFGDRISFNIGEYNGKQEARNITLVRPLCDAPEDVLPSPRVNPLDVYVAWARTFVPADCVKPVGVVDETNL